MTANNIYRLLTFIAVSLGLVITVLLGLGCAPPNRIEAVRNNRAEARILRHEDAETGVVCYAYLYASISCVVPKRMPLTLPAEKPLGEAPPELLPRPR